MIETVCAKFRKQNHPNNTLLLTWAAFLSHFRPILHDLFKVFATGGEVVLYNYKGLKPG